MKTPSNSNARVSETGLEKVIVRWRPPRDNIVKFNSDAQFKLSTGRGFSGIVCRDHRGKLLTGVASPMFASSPLVAETLALREVVSLAANLNFHQALFESDCLDLVEA